MFGRYLYLGVLLSISWGGVFAKIGGRKQKQQQQKAQKTSLNKERRRLQPTDINATGTTEESFPLGLCWGDCDIDDECASGLICFQRDANVAVPGCEGGENDNSLTDYCITDPSEPAPTGKPTGSPTPGPTVTPTRKPSGEPTVSPAPSSATATMKPTQKPTNEEIPASDTFGTVEYVGNEGTFYAPYPLGACKGDCDSDADCADGLYCHQRLANEPVPYCEGGEADDSTADYCTWDGVTLPRPDLPGPAPKPYFRLKLYWEEGYHWQNETFEREWCMMYSFDGYPGTGLCWIGDKDVKCDKDEVYMAKCVDEPRQWFTFVNVTTSDEERQVLVRTGDGRCFEREERKIYLDKCDASRSQQRWFALNGDLDGEKFELSQLGYTQQCMTNDHHPKSGEVVELHSCEASRSNESQTSYWEKF